MCVCIEIRLKKQKNINDDGSKNNNSTRGIKWTLFVSLVWEIQKRASHQSCIYVFDLQWVMYVMCVLGVCVFVCEYSMCVLCVPAKRREKKSRNNEQNTTDRSMQSNESYTIGFVTSFDWLCIPDLTARAHRRLPRLEQSRKKEFFVLAKALTL